MIRREARELALGILTVAAVVAIAYLPALRLGFYGDDWIFYDIAGRLSWSDYLVKYFDPRVQTAWYRPVQGVLFRLEYLAFGTNTLGYHLVNVLIHLACCLLLFAVLKRATNNRRVAMVAALIFAALPTAALAVFWPGVIDALETLFYLAAVWFWLGYLQNGRPRDYALAFAAFLLALFTKEIGVTLPVSLLLVEWFVARQPIRLVSLRRYIPFLVVWLGYFPLEYIVTRRSVFVNQIGYAPDVARFALNLVDYLAMLAFPWGFFAPLSYLWLAVVAAVLAYLILARKYYALIPPIAGATLAILPVVPFPFVASRFLYLAVVASAILMALAFEWALRRTSRLLFFVLAGVVVIGSMMISSAAADFGEWARVSRVPFRNVSQWHPAPSNDTLYYFVRPPVPGSNLSGMFLWRFGTQVSVLADDMSHTADLRAHAQTFIEYFDADGNQHEISVRKDMSARAMPSLPINLGDAIRLEGFELANSTLAQGEPLILLLYWRGLKPTNADYTVSVRFISQNGTVAAQRDQVPRQGDAPTSRWVPGELVVDAIILPVQVSAGMYRLEVGLHDSSTGQWIRALSGAERIVVEPLQVEQ